MRINGDLVPITSGACDIGDHYIPYLEVHQESGFFYQEAAHGKFGVIRYNGDTGALQGSTDNGVTFQDFSLGAGVNNIGVLGQADLTGNVDFATQSGFLNVYYNGQTIFHALDTTSLSGFWGLESFDDVVNHINVQGQAQLVDDVVLQSGVFTYLGQNDQNIQIEVDTAALSGHFGLKNMDNMVKGYQETIGAAATTWTIDHNLGTTKVIVQAWDDTGNALVILADDIERTTANQIKVYFNTAQAGEVVVMGF